MFSVVHRFVRQCLSLLSALVSQGPEAAREVLSHIHINKALSGLAKRKDKKVSCSTCLFWFPACVGVVVFYRHVCLHSSLQILQGRPDVRMAFIQFVLSFLVSGDNDTVGQILEIKGNRYIWIQIYLTYSYLHCVDDMLIWCVRTFARDPEYRSEGGEDDHSQSDCVHTED